MGTFFVVIFAMVGTKFDDCGTKFNELGMKYNPEVIKYTWTLSEKMHPSAALRTDGDCIWASRSMFDHLGIVFRNKFVKIRTAVVKLRTQPVGP